MEQRLCLVLGVGGESRYLGRESHRGMVAKKPPGHLRNALEEYER